MSVMDQPDEPDEPAVDPDIRHEVADAEDDEPTTSEQAEDDA